MQRSIFFLMLLACAGCITTDTAFTKVAPGLWRGVLILEKPEFPVADKDSITIVYDQFKPGELPFNFEVIYDTPDNFHIEIINGDERIRCDSIVYGRDRTSARDTFNVHFPEYQSYLHIEVRGNVMQGYFTVTTKANYRIPFVADAGRDYRFTNMKLAPQGDISGNWATLLGVDSENPEKAIGEFKQTGNRLTGTFRTETGDYRYMEGTVQGRKFWLSCFDGSHAFLVSGSVQGDSLQGEFRSGKAKPSLLTAWRDPQFQLGDAATLTQWKGDQPLKFAVTTPDGRALNFPGSEYANKVSIFTIMGTWCPNCLDEQRFLAGYLKSNPDFAAQMAVTAFTFERPQDSLKLKAHLLNYKKKLGLPYDIVHAGKANKEEAAAFFPGLSQVMAFPTMMIVDKKGKVRFVHTGFDGPATSRHVAFKQEFDQWIRTLIAETN
jgi:thiol-disulfide isomerase/thioredoxin